MHNVLISLIEKLPDGYLMIMVPLFAAAFLWTFSHVRRDKQGKIYFYNQKYEDSKRNRKQDAILKEVSKLTTDMVDMKQFREGTASRLDSVDGHIKEQTDVSKEERANILQLQICAQNLPVVAKQEAYLAYKRLGCNSWIDEYVVENGLFTREDVSFIRGNMEKAARLGNRN